MFLQTKNYNEYESEPKQILIKTFSMNTSALIEKLLRSIFIKVYSILFYLW